MTSRFDYVEYDEEAQKVQKAFKGQMELMEAVIEDNIKCPRSKALILTNLEVVYMWIGKGVRNDQIERNKNTSLQEQRTNS